MPGTMSMSSGTTLISPAATVASMRSSQGGGASGPSNPPTKHRTSSHSHHAHQPRRRASLHHGHSHHGHHAGPSRRTSEGEHGRRAMTAGLAMQVLEAANGEKPKRAKSKERPMAKASRSDTHLPRLSRTTSITSEASQGSRGSRGSDPKRRPKGQRRKRSGESIEILSGDGKESGEVVDDSDEAWESGEEETKPATKTETQPESKGKQTSVRRTVSDTQAEVPSKADDAKANIDTLDLSGEHAPLTQRTTGFAGTIHTPAPDMALETQAMKNVSTPHYNDPTHVMPAHQIKHQQSSRSISMTMSNTEVPTISAIDEEKTPKPGTMQRTESPETMQRTDSPGTMQRTGSGQRAEVQQDNRPSELRPEPHHMRSTEGSSMPSKPAADTSPSFPFPKMQPHPVQQATPPTSTESVTRARQSDPPRPSEKGENRQRMASGTEPRLRHRYSNSSIRSVQSLRAPPHPLNSPTGGYRTGLPSVATSRPGSMLSSPQKVDRRGPNMHHPPIAPPVVYREVISGEGWPIPEEGEAGGSSSTTSMKAPPNDRKASFSSQQSLQGLMAARSKTNGRASSLGPGSMKAPSRRRTAVEVAAAAAKMPTTNDPVEYHHSLGYPSTSAETAHLISRFLPHKPRMLDWEIPTAELNDPDRLGLPRGDYRDSHDSLLRMMKDSSLTAPSMRRSGSRSLSYQNLLAPGLAADGSQQVGALTGRHGALAVTKGGWKGKTPFELSADRCMAQRPGM